MTFNKSQVEVTSNDRNEATFTWKARNFPKVMSGAFQESCQWLSVTEESLFLHDGLIRVTDLVELPRDVNNTQEGDNEVITFDLKSPRELSDRLLAVCGTQNNAYSRLLEYRLNALKGLWGAQKQVSADEQQERESSTHEETIALLKKQGLFKEPEQASFSTRISVLLVIPLLQSQSKVDSSLCGVTAELLLNCLKDCAPLSLSKEPGDCLWGLENLLCTWLGEKSESSTEQIVKDVGQRRNAASALVALACARYHYDTMTH